MRSLKVISFCLWGSEPRYTVGLIKNIELASIFYPDWVCWVYIHHLVSRDIFDFLLTCKNVKTITINTDEVVPTKFMLNRFLPILSFDVKCFISRDIDTRIQPREVLAVDEWLESNKTLHIMRDHPQHFPRILGGMYGIKCSDELSNFNWIDSINNFFTVNNNKKDDQDFLLAYIYSKFENERIVHDEIRKYEGFECKPFPIPFEKNGLFVGCYIYEDDSTDNFTKTTLLSWLHNNLKHRISTDDVSYHDKLFYLQKKIDNIYIVHYTKLTERKKSLTLQINKLLIDKFINCNWIDNFDRESISDDTFNNSFKYDPNIVYRHITDGEKANHLAYYHIIKQIFHNDNISLVLEDDTIFKDNFINHLFYIINNLPDKWDIICLGGPTDDCVYPCKSLPNSTRSNFYSNEIKIYKPETPAPQTASCLLFNKSGSKKLLSCKYMFPFSAPIDHTIWVCSMDNNINMFWSQPWISFEGSKYNLFQTSFKERGF